MFQVAKICSKIFRNFIVIFGKRYKQVKSSSHMKDIVIWMKLSIKLVSSVSLADTASDYESRGPQFKTWVTHRKMKFSQWQEVPYLELFHLFK